MGDQLRRSRWDRTPDLSLEEFTPEIAEAILGSDEIETLILWYKDREYPGAEDSPFVAVSHTEEVPDGYIFRKYIFLWDCDEPNSMVEYESVLEIIRKGMRHPLSARAEEAVSRAATWVSKSTLHRWTKEGYFLDLRSKK
jgi:hypothetical protein